MTQEEKELLHKDICARLPYNPLVEYKGEEYNVLGIAHGRLVLCKPFMSYTLKEHPLVEEVKPYLFPLSSMTEEQKQEYSYIVNYISPDDTENWKEGEFIYVEQVTQLIHFYLINHLDFRGLIPMDLAIDATGLNVY